MKISQVEPVYFMKYRNPKKLIFILTGKNLLLTEDSGQMIKPLYMVCKGIDMTKDRLVSKYNEDVIWACYTKNIMITHHTLWLITTVQTIINWSWMLKISAPSLYNDRPSMVFIILSAGV